MTWTHEMPTPGLWWLALPDQDRALLVSVIQQDDGSLLLVGMGAAQSLPLGVLTGPEDCSDVMWWPVELPPRAPNQQYRCACGHELNEHYEDTRLCMILGCACAGPHRHAPKSVRIGEEKGKVN